MATASEVDIKLDKVANDIYQNRERLKGAKSTIAARVVNLNAIPATYADLLATINDENYGTGADEEVNKARLAALTDEYLALVAEAEAARDWLNGNVTEF